MSSLELPVKSGMEYTNSKYWRESVERREPSYTVGGNVNWYSYYGEQYGVPLKKKKKKLKIELPYDAAVPLLGLYPEKKHDFKGSMHPNIHCSTVYNSQDMEAI